MGLCVSCGITALAALEHVEPVSTAKVIFPDGRLQEHRGGLSIRTSRELANKGLSLPPACFLCIANDLADGNVAALADDDVLEPGQIYFVLPVRILKRRLAPVEMAKLAIRAAGAIARVEGLMLGREVPNAAAAPNFDESEKNTKIKKVEPTARRRSRRSYGRGRDFTSYLAAIPE